jgi:transcriptional regulator with XRE-family HTH domain
MEQMPVTRYEAKNVASTIREQGRSVAWLAREIGLSRQYTSDAVHGNVVVKSAIAEKIAKALGVPLFLIFDVSDSGDIPLMSTSEAIPA